MVKPEPNGKLLKNEVHKNRMNEMLWVFKITTVKYNENQSSFI